MLNKINFWKLLIGWIVLLTIFYCVLSIVRHDHFQSGGFDLGLYDQAIWLYSQFQFPYSTIKERLILGDHLTLTLPLLTPFYWLWNDVRLLLIFQAAWIASSALPIYLIGLKRKFSAFTSLILAIIYSLFYGIQFAVQFDFHPIMIGVGLLAWIAYFLEAGKKKWLIITLILLLLTQENMGLALTSLGLIYFWRKEFRKISIGFIIGGLVASFLAIKFTGLLSPIGFEYAPQFSSDPLTLLAQYFDHPEKRLSWFYSFAWFSFLPILSPGAVLAVGFDLAQYFLTGNAVARMWSPYAHHRAILSVFLILGTFETLELFRKLKIKIEIVAVFMLFIVFGLQLYYHFPLNKLSKKEFWQNEAWMEDNYKLLTMIPASASVAAQQNLVPHLSHRQEIYLAWPRLHGETWLLDFAGKPEFLVIDRRPNQWLTQILENQENFEKAIMNMEKAGKITLVQRVNDAYLYRLNY